MKIPKWLLWTGQIVLVVAVTYGIVRALAPDVSELTRSDFSSVRPNWPLLLLSLVMLVGMYLAHCMIWRAITGSLNGRTPGLKSSLRMFFVSGLGRYIPGKFWQIAGLAALAQKSGVSPLAATAASIKGQVGFLLSGLVYLLVLLPGWGGAAPIVGTIVLTLFVLGAYVLLQSRARHWLAARSPARLRAVLDAFENITWRDAVIVWLAYAATWVLLGAAFVVFARSFAPLDAGDYLHVAGTVAAAYLFGYVMIFSLAGLGIREAVMLGLLNDVMPQSAAVLVAVGSRLWFTAAELLPLALIPVVKDR